MRPYIRVQHIDPGEGVVGTFNPLQPRFAFRVNDIGDLSYELALTNPQVTRDAFAPKRTDFRLQVSHDGAFWQTIMGGFHWPVALNNEEGTVKIQGMDWAAYLDQPMWFPAYEINARDLVGPTNTIKQIMKEADSWAKVWIGKPGTDRPGVTFNATQQTIVEDLINLVANGNDGTLNINTTFTGDGTGWSEVLNYQIMFQDETTILDHIKAISDLDDPLGFDFFMNWDKTLVCYNPMRSASIASINPIFEITRGPDSPLVALQWENQGPIATHSVITGPGSPAWWAVKTYGPSVDTYRRWLKISKLGGNYRMPKQVDSAARGNLDRFPHKELKMTVKPDAFDLNDPTAFFHPLIGEALYIDVDFPPYHRINANFWIVGQDFSTDEAGNWTCDVSLQQVYDPTGIG